MPCEYLLLNAPPSAVAGGPLQLGPGGTEGSRREVVLAMGWRALTLLVSSVPCMWGTGFVNLRWGLEASWHRVLGVWFLGRSLGRSVHPAPASPCRMQRMLPPWSAALCGPLLPPHADNRGRPCPSATSGAGSASPGPVCALLGGSSVFCVSRLPRVEILKAAPCIIPKREDGRNFGLSQSTGGGASALHLLSGYRGRCVRYPVPRSARVYPAACSCHTFISLILPTKIYNCSCLHGCTMILPFK